MEIYLEHTFERLQEFDKYDLIDIILSNQEKLKELQSKHEQNWIIYKNIKHTHMEFTHSQSQLIEYALEELLNSDDFDNLPEQARKDMRILLNKFFDLSRDLAQ